MSQNNEADKILKKAERRVENNQLKNALNRADWYDKIFLNRKIKKTFPKIRKHFSEYELLFFLNNPESELTDFHFGLGMWIRKNILIPEPQLCALFLKAEIKRLDDMSAIIIKKYLKYIANKE